jgi:hypothetical protein
MKYIEFIIIAYKCIFTALSMLFYCFLLLSVFAYGATGAGKTHTMLGSEQHPGVIYHTMIHLYRHIAAVSHEKTCDIAVSYLEVNKKIIIIMKVL